MRSCRACRKFSTIRRIPRICSGETIWHSRFCQAALDLRFCSPPRDDEFEFLDVDGAWIHVQISGASRGYIREASVELPEPLAAR